MCHRCGAKLKDEGYLTVFGPVCFKCWNEYIYKWDHDLEGHVIEKGA